MGRVFHACTIKDLPKEKWEHAAAMARLVNPVNAPAMTTGIPISRIAVLTSKYWGSKGVKLSVGFLDKASTELQRKILAYMNRWKEYGNVEFALSSNSNTANVRITLDPRGGYWSYMGTDILSVSGPTMNLGGFSLSTPESEYERVVTHETGHTLGFPHEHMRDSLVSRLDVQKTIAYFQRTQGWNAQTTRQQVLTPLSESSLMGTPPDDTSIMCYQLPGDITKDGKPIRGGTRINATDAKFIATIHPPLLPPPTEPPPTNPGGSAIVTMVGLDSSGKEVSRFKLAA